MEEKQKYICSFCGAEYDTATERARCELGCDEKHKQNVERMKRRLLMGKKQERRDEIKEMNDRLNKLVAKYYQDYGESVVIPVGVSDLIRAMWS